MKRKLLYSSLLLVIMLMTGCTRYASASPTPATAGEEPKFEFPTPTLMALEVEVATRTPIPLMLKTATPTLALDEMATGTGEEDMQKEVTPGEEMATSEGENSQSSGASLYKSPTPFGTKTTTGVTTIATQAVPTWPPQVVLSGKPTVEIVHVKYAESITLNISNLPASAQITIRMGSANSYGADGPVVETVKSDDKGKISKAFKIPAELQGYGTIGVRIEYPDGYTASFYFGNRDY